MRIEELERELRAERPEPSHRLRPATRRVGRGRIPARPRARPAYAPERRRRARARLGPPHLRARHAGSCCRRRGGGDDRRHRRGRDRQQGQPEARGELRAGADRGRAVRRQRRAAAARGSSCPVGGGCRACPNRTGGAASDAAATRRVDLAPGAPRPGRRRRHRPRRRERIVDATARITLGAEADEVQEVANGVVEVTDRYDGVVINSQVTSDQAGARAAFELEIPFRELDAALADLSGLADVISRTEAGEDITARAVRARKDLADCSSGFARRGSS